jgi:hypothetical protein
MALILDGTAGETFPSWTTATRPASPAVGQMGYNTTTANFDQYTAGGWVTTINSSTGVVLASQMPTGSVLQVVQGRTSTQVTTTSATFVDTGITATITPKFSTSKILVITSVNGIFVGSPSGSFGNFQLVKNSTVLDLFGYVTGYQSYVGFRGGNANYQYLDSPATTSVTTYKVQFSQINGATVDVQRDSSASSVITLLEIAG